MLSIPLNLIISVIKNEHFSKAHDLLEATEVLLKIEIVSSKGDHGRWLVWPSWLGVV